MAELERAERNDEGRAREWIARALMPRPIPHGPPKVTSPIAGCRRRLAAGSMHSSGACRSPVWHERAGDRAGTAAAASRAQMNAELQPKCADGIAGHREEA